MKKIISLLSLLSLFTLAQVEAKVDLFGGADELHINVNNRILAKVNGKAISVIDVMKKMDVLFYRQFPEYTSNVSARFQFYNINWKHVLSELIDKELILAEAEEHKLPISNGDIRQEMESLFGPNIITNLDKIGMTYDEAWKIVKGDILLRRMLYIRVNNKAMRLVTPQSIRAAYEEFARENVRLEEWHYNVISIRDKDKEKGAQLADSIYALLKDKKTSISDLATYIKENEIGKGSSLNISQEYKHSDKEMSEAYKDIVTKLSNDEYSAPISQKSRDNSTVFRIFYLKEKYEGGTPPFSEVAGKLKDKLIETAMEKETDVYLKKLHQHFDVQESHLVDLSDEEYQPFTLS